MKLWTSSAVAPHGNQYGGLYVVADSREEAITKAREALHANGRDNYVPREEYRQNLMDNLEATTEEVASGVFIDWASPERK